jgi:hypothetical protein
MIFNLMIYIGTSELIKRLQEEVPWIYTLHISLGLLLFPLHLTIRITKMVILIFFTTNNLLWLADRGWRGPEGTTTVGRWGKPSKILLSVS